jgi:hypothetical protein
MLTNQSLLALATAHKLRATRRQLLGRAFSNLVLLLREADAEPESVAYYQSISAEHSAQGRRSLAAHLDLIGGTRHEVDYPDGNW